MYRANTKRAASQESHLKRVEGFRALQEGGALAAGAAHGPDHVSNSNLIFRFSHTRLRCDHVYIGLSRAARLV